MLKGEFGNYPPVLGGRKGGRLSVGPGSPIFFSLQPFPLVREPSPRRPCRFQRRHRPHPTLDDTNFPATYLPAFG